MQGVGGWFNLKSAGIADDMETTLRKFDEVTRAHPWKGRHNKVIWMGRTTGHQRRDFDAYFNGANGNPKWKELVDFHVMRWEGEGKEAPRPFLEQAEYRYVLDMEGNGYSARTAKLFLLRTTVILVEGSDWPYTPYFLRYFTPWVHFIPMRFETTDATLTWMFNNPDICERIAEAGTKRAQEVRLEYAYETQCSIAGIGVQGLYLRISLIREDS